MCCLGAWMCDGSPHCDCCSLSVSASFLFTGPTSVLAQWHSWQEVWLEWVAPLNLCTLTSSWTSKETDGSCLRHRLNHQVASSVRCFRVRRYTGTVRRNSWWQAEEMTWTEDNTIQQLQFWKKKKKKQLLAKTDFESKRSDVSNISVDALNWDVDL